MKKEYDGTSDTLDFIEQEKTVRLWEIPGYVYLSDHWKEYD